MCGDVKESDLARCEAGARQGAGKGWEGGTQASYEGERQGDEGERQEVFKGQLVSAPRMSLHSPASTQLARGGKGGHR